MTALAGWNKTRILSLEKENLPIESKKLAFESLKVSDSSKIVDINTSKSFVSMHIPGQGIKSFHHSKVFHSKPTDKADFSFATLAANGYRRAPVSQNSQQYVYENATMESIFSLMNGYNACLLCYGQTGI